MLIEGKKIVAVGPNLKAAAVIDGSDRKCRASSTRTITGIRAVLGGIIADAVEIEQLRQIFS